MIIKNIVCSNSKDIFLINSRYRRQDKWYCVSCVALSRKISTQHLEHAVDVLDHSSVLKQP